MICCQVRVLGKVAYGKRRFDMEKVDIKSKVYTLYDKDKRYPSYVVIIENSKNSISIVTEMSLKSRLMFAWYFIRHKNFSIKSHLLEEKNEKEIDEYNNGKGLKRRI